MNSTFLILFQRTLLHKTNTGTLLRINQSLLQSTLKDIFTLSLIDLNTDAAAKACIVIRNQLSISAERLEEDLRETSRTALFARIRSLTRRSDIRFCN